MVAITNVDDGEIGRGRRNDSSSSRESSPQQTQKRSFTPTSDDGDLIAPIAYDDTPPPSERPIIRQAVAFSWDTSSVTSAPATINTYQASLPPEPTLYGTRFLPGQEVPGASRPPPKSRGSHGTFKSKKAGSSTRKVRHFNDEFSSQTGSFRLKAYDPTAPPVPPTTHGTGPYSSLYRASPADASQTRRRTSPAQATTSRRNGHSRDSGKTTASASKAKTASSKSKPFLSKTQEPNSKFGDSVSRAKPSSSASITRASSPNPSSRQRSEQMTHPDYCPTEIEDTSPTPTNGYYRRDYERNKDLVTEVSGRSRSPTISSTDQRSPLLDTSLSESHTLDNAVLFQQAHNPAPPPVENSARAVASVNVNPELKRITRQLRMLTILIQDIRSGTTDHQLAEVKVPLRVADDPQDGYWADAKEVCDKLQSSPSRIDGPAKVYTLRGKYRQFFLRVSSENVDVCISANLIVSRDRTLDVVVEDNPPPGTTPLPPRIPREFLRTPTPDSEYIASPSPSLMAHDNFIHRHSTDEFSMNIRKRRHSPSFDTSPYSSPSQNASSVQQSAVVNVPPKKQRSYAQGSQDHTSSNDLGEIKAARSGFQRQDDGYDSSGSEEEPEKLHGLIAKAVSSSLEEDARWQEFFKSKGKPSRAGEVLKQYQFVQRMVDIWVGQKVQVASRQHVIKKSHILTALHIDDGNYASDCSETLDLLKLYGPNGQRTTDTRVIAMINDQTLPMSNAEPIKQLLRLLREIDEKWVADRLEIRSTLDSSTGDITELA